MKPFLLLSTRPEDAAANGEREAIARLGGLSEGGLVQFRVEAAPLPLIDLDEYAGVFLGGGPFNASDEPKTAWQIRIEADVARILDTVLERNMPFLGLCYGVGALVSHLNGVVDRTYGEEAGAATVTLTPEGRRDPLFHGLPDEIVAFVGHKEASRQLPKGAVLLASGRHCPVQAFRVGQWAYATQFHPELDRPGMASRIEIYNKEGYFAPSETQRLVEFAYSAGITPEVHKILSNFVSLARENSATLA